MTFIRKHSGDNTKPIVAVYSCPEHGEMDVEVQRDENGEAPDVAACPVMLTANGDALGVNCDLPATWTPSVVGCRVRRIEVVRGGWEKPERSTYLDTRKLGEGQDIEEFRAERRKVWDEKRKADVMAFKRGM